MRRLIRNGTSTAIVPTTIGKPVPLAPIAEGDAQIVDGGAVRDGQVVKTDRGRHAVAKLGGVLDVVDAGVGVVAA